MDLFEKLINVSLSFDTPPRHASAAETSGHGSGDSSVGGGGTGMSIIPRQPLRGQLVLSFENADASKTGDAIAFLSQIGEHSMRVAWRHLLERLTLVPFLLDRADTDDAKARASTSAQSSPRSMPEIELAEPTLCKNNFVFGVPAFWNDKLYAHSGDEVDESDEEEEGTEEGPDGEGVHLPCRTAGEAFEVDAAGVKTVTTPHASAAASADEGIPAAITSRYDVEFTVPDVSSKYLDRPAALAFVLLLSPFADPPAPPGSAVPDDWPPYQRYVVMRVLARAFVDPFDPATSGIASLYSMHTILLGCQYLPVTVKRALACQSVTCPLSNDRLLLNLNITNVSSSPVVLHSASLDVYSTCTTAPSGNSSGKKPRTKHEHPHLSSWAKRAQERRALQHSLWAEQRAGPAGGDMRTIDVLTKIVTVTPMVVSDDRPPFTLHAQETYSFQFIMEVLPQLCYLLNPKSLQYVYARHAEQQQQQQQHGGTVEEAGEEGGEAGAMVGRDTVAAPFKSSVEAVITDCYGKPVSNEEILSVLSATYLSHLFVYFDLAAADSEVQVTSPAGDGHHGKGASPALVKADGLHLRHAAKWSFGAS